jgi:hypothetical protein
MDFYLAASEHLGGSGINLSYTSDWQNFSIRSRPFSRFAMLVA